MKYVFSPEVNLSFTPEQFKSMFKDLNPQDAQAEEAVRQLAQNIINSYFEGKLMTRETHNDLLDSAVREAANDFRYRHGPGGC